MYLKLESEGKDKGESRWREGIFLGIRGESGELIVGTNEGTVKARTLRRHGREEDRWKTESWDKICGVPWECIPGRRGVEIVPDVKDGSTWRRRRRAHERRGSRSRNPKIQNNERRR